MRTAAITTPAGLGFVLREARMSSGLTQRALAAELGVAQSYVAELEAGKDIKAVERLFDIARITGLTLYAETQDD